MVAPRTSKSITAWWLLSNLKQVPLDMKRQIKEKHQIFPNTNLDPLVKSGGYLQLRSFTFLRRTISIYDHFTPWQLVAVPKLQFLRKHCWHQMEQHRRTSFEPCRETCNSGTCAIRQDYYGGSQDEQNNHCSVAGVELQTNATGHAMSNQQWEQVILKKILDPLRTADDYLQVYSFIFGLCAVSIWDQLRPWQLVAVPKLKVLCSRLCCRDIDPNRQNTEHSLEESFWNFATIPLIDCPLDLPGRVVHPILWYI